MIRSGYHAEFDAMQATGRTRSDLNRTFGRLRGSARQVAAHMKRMSAVGMTVAEALDGMQRAFDAAGWNWPR